MVPHYIIAKVALQRVPQTTPNSISSLAKTLAIQFVLLASSSIPSSISYARLALHYASNVMVLMITALLQQDVLAASFSSITPASPLAPMAHTRI